MNVYQNYFTFSQDSCQYYYIDLITSALRIINFTIILCQNYHYFLIPFSTLTSMQLMCNYWFVLINYGVNISLIIWTKWSTALFVPSIILCNLFLTLWEKFANISIAVCRKKRCSQSIWIDPLMYLFVYFHVRIKMLKTRYVDTIYLQQLDRRFLSSLFDGLPLGFNLK